MSVLSIKLTLLILYCLWAVSLQQSIVDQSACFQRQSDAIKSGNPCLCVYNFVFTQFVQRDVITVTSPLSHEHRARGHAPTKSELTVEI